MYVCVHAHTRANEKEREGGVKRQLQRGRERGEGGRERALPFFLLMHKVGLFSLLQFVCLFVVVVVLVFWGTKSDSFRE